jgi:hypothetical protein
MTHVFSTGAQVKHNSASKISFLFIITKDSGASFTMVQLIFKTINFL